MRAIERPEEEGEQRVKFVMLGGYEICWRKFLTSRGPPMQGVSFDFLDSNRDSSLNWYYREHSKNKIKIKHDDDHKTDGAAGNCYISNPANPKKPNGSAQIISYNPESTPSSTTEPRSWSS